MNTVLRIENVHKSFGSAQVLCGINLDIPEGSISSIVGQSGSGKSVLFKIVMGMIKPEQGSVWYRDTEITALERQDLISVRQHFGYAFQNAALFDSMTVEENLAFPLREVLNVRSKTEIKKRIRRVLDWIELPGIELKRPDELSGGMRKRVGVARSLVMQPDVLFFDEPTTGLDPVLAETINNLVVRVNKELGITCILITHDIPAAFRISHKLFFLDQGVIVADGSPAEVAASEHSLVRDFIRISFSELDV